jgi:archaellum component FlaC
MPKTARSRSARAGAVLVALWWCAAPDTSLAQDLDAAMAEGREFERVGACERAYNLYREARGAAQNLGDPARRAQLDAVLQTKLYKLQECYERCQPSDTDREVYERARSYESRGQMKRVRQMLKRLLVGKDLKCRFWSEVKGTYDALPLPVDRAEAVADPCEVEDDLKQEIEMARQQIATAREELAKYDGVDAGTVLSKVNDIVALYRQIDDLRVKVFGFREELLNCDDTYQDLLRDTVGLKDVYDTASGIVMQAYQDRVADLDKKVRSFRAKYDQTRKQLDATQAKLKDLEAQYADLADFTEELFGDFFDLVGMEVRTPAGSLEEGGVQIPFEELDAVLADQRRTLEAMEQRFPEYLHSAAGREGLKRRRLVLEKMKMLLEKFQARGYRGVLGFEKTRIELQANLAILNRVEALLDAQQTPPDGKPPTAADVLGAPPPEDPGATLRIVAIAGAVVGSAVAGALVAVLVLRRRRGF